LDRRHSFGQPAESGSSQIHDLDVESGRGTPINGSTMPKGMPVDENAKGRRPSGVILVGN